MIYSSLTFLIRKVSKRTSHPKHHFILAKLLRFQRTFHEKSFVSGFGAEAPTDNDTQKKHGVAALFIFDHYMLELRSKPPSLTFLIRKVSKRISHRIRHFIFAKLLNFQETFREKFLASGSHGRYPQHLTTNTALFFQYRKNHQHF